MTQTIDPVKLKAAAEHLEWVCQQYPDVQQVQELYQGLLPMIKDAKNGRISQPVERIPYDYAFSDSAYDGYANPSITSAYYSFSTEMEGGLTEQDKRIIADLEARIQVKAENVGVQL